MLLKTYKQKQRKKAIVSYHSSYKSYLSIHIRIIIDKKLRNRSMNTNQKNMQFKLESFVPPGKDLPGKEAGEKAFYEILNLFIRAVEKGEFPEITDIKIAFSSGNGDKSYTRIYHVVIGGKIKTLSIIIEETRSDQDYSNNYIREESNYIHLPEELEDVFKNYVKDLAGWEFIELSPAV